MLYDQFESSRDAVPLTCHEIKPPCWRNQYCQSKVDTGWNEFFLQSRKHEDFFLNFSQRYATSRLLIVERGLEAGLRRLLVVV